MAEDKSSTSCFAGLCCGNDNAVHDESAETVQNVPGYAGCTFVNLIRLLIQGQNFYRSKRDSIPSDIYKVNIKEKRIVLCSHETINYLYKSPNVNKEPAFGFMLFNKPILDNQIPLIFENGERHNEQRKIFMELSKLIFCKDTFLKDTFEMVESEMLRLNDNAEVLEDFETTVGNATYNILSMVLFGVKMDNQMVAAWLDNCLVENPDNVKEEAVKAYQTLRDAIMESPKFKQLMENVKEADIQVSPSDVCNQMLFSFVFNGGAALKLLTISMFIMMKTQSDKVRKSLQQDIHEFLKKGNFRMDEFQRMENIQSFLLETLRLFPPAPYIFRRAQQDFVLSTQSGNFQINKGNLLQGNIYLSNRDPKVFEDADVFQALRFAQSPELKNSIASFGIPETPGKLQEQESSCAGPQIIMMLGQIILGQITRAEYEFCSEPTYTGKSIRRFTASDKPVKVKTFKISKI